MSTDSIFSASWYRVARLKPRLRSHAQIHRHLYRGRLWYVLQDHSSGRFHRFSPMAYFIIGSMDGHTTIDAIWRRCFERFGDDAPTQEQVIGLLAQLHAADVLLSGVPPDIAELSSRSRSQERQRKASRWRSPLAIRIPLIDPDRLLDRVAPYLGWLFGPIGAGLWLGLCGSAGIQAALHWSELSADITDRVLALENLFLLALIFPVVKLFHEIGHALAVKRWGGEVHEMGIMLLVFVPVPYLDASATSAFRAKRRRALVGAAGMLVELAIAAIAMFVWVNVQPGLVRSVAFNTLLIAGVSTLLFNGNPLLRFDGYYILMDWLEIPNLATRANRYIGYLLRRYLFGLRDTEQTDAEPGERVWLICFAIGSFAYRMFVLTFIIVLVASQYFVVGVLLALWAAYTSLIVPLSRLLKSLFTDSSIAPRRMRAIAMSSACLVGLVALLTYVPVPYRTEAQGIVWVPEDAGVRAGVQGFVGELLVSPAERVRAGQALISSSDPELTSRVRMLEAQVGELRARYDAAFATDRVAAATLDEELELVTGRLADARDRAAALTIRSPVDGIFMLPGSVADLPGRYLHRGELVAYVAADAAPTVRVLVPEARIDIVRQRTRAVELRLAEAVDRVLSAQVWNEVPGATEELPSLALSLAGGGKIAMDPAGADELRALQPFFQFDLMVEGAQAPLRLGGRAYVRFLHDPEPLAYRWYRSARQLLLEVFDV